jgi:TPR repeat protein
MPDKPIFFSYSRTDSAFVLKLAKDLRKAGANIWLDQLDIKAGSHWDSSIETALNTSTSVIIVLSPASVASNNVMDEVSFALETNKTVIPILISECVVPFRLRRVQRVNFIGDYQEALNQLMEVLGYTEKSSEETMSGKTQSDLSETISAETNPLESQKDKELETLLWENAKAKNTPDALLEYLRQYPHGTYEANALSAVKAIEEIEEQKAVGSSASTSNTVKQTKKKPGSRKYVFIGIGVIIVALVLWKSIPKNSGESSDDNAIVVNFQDSLRFADSFFKVSQYGSAWSIYQSLDTNNLEDTTALVNIGDLYYYGNAVGQDDVQAKSWYEKAVNSGSGSAMYMIGFLYHNGYGGASANDDSARSWYDKACDAGYEAGCNARDSIPLEK